MGIRGMFGFMNRNQLKKSIDLLQVIPEDQKCVVIDGENLIFMLYLWSAHWGIGLPCSWVHGGQTLHWYHVLKNFFELFLRQDVRIIVMLDGLKEAMHVAKAQNQQRAKKDSMVACLRGRRRQGSHDGESIPLLYRKVFLEVVRDLQALYPPNEAGQEMLHYSTATFEADPVCVEACRDGGVYGVIGADTDFISLVATAQAMPAYADKKLIYIQLDSLMVTEGGHMTFDCYPVQEVADMLGLTLEQMAMMGSLVENDFMKHATQLKEFHYRIGVLRHPMDTVVCVGKYLKEGGSEDPNDIFMAETDQTVRAAYAARLRESVLSYTRPNLQTYFRLRGAEAAAAIQQLPVEENPDYPDHNLLRLLIQTGLHDAFREGRIEPSTVQILWDVHEMKAGRTPQRPVSYRTPETLIDWISRGKHPSVLLWPLRRRLVETTLALGGGDDATSLSFRDNLLGDRVICPVRTGAHDPAARTGRAMLLDELKCSFFSAPGSDAAFAKVSAALLSSEAASLLSDTECLHVVCMLACVAAGCGSRWHYYSPLNQEDTLFFVKCVMMALVLRADRTKGSEDELAALALKVHKRLSPNDLCMTVLLSCMSACLHHMDGVIQNRELLASKGAGGAADAARAAQEARRTKLSGGAGAEGHLAAEWLDSCDGRLAHAVLQIALEARSEESSFDPFSLAASEAQKSKATLLSSIPWDEVYMLNWKGDVTRHVPAAEQSNLAEMNDLQLDMWEREIVDGDDTAQDDGTGGQADDDVEDDREDDGETDEEAEAAEEEAAEEEQADNTTMEQDEWWMHGEDEGGGESTSLSAPSDTNFLQLPKLLQESDYASIDWPSVLAEDRWGDEVDAVAEAVASVTSIDAAYKALDPPTVGGTGNEITSRMTTSMVIPRGPWRTHLGIKETDDEAADDEAAEIEIDISRKWADVAESVPPMPRREPEEFKDGILIGVSVGKDGQTTYKGESSWRPPMRNRRANEREFKPETFTFVGRSDPKAETGCKFRVTTTPHPNAHTVKLSVYGSLDITPLPPRTPLMVQKRQGTEDATGLSALTDIDRKRAKVDGIYDALISRAKQLRDNYAVTTNERSTKKVQVWEDHTFTEYRPHQFQVDAFTLIRNNKSVLVTAPTGAGKTEVAMCAVNQALNSDERLIFICPTKALVNQTVLTILAYFQEYPDWQKKRPSERLCGFNYMDEFGKVNTDAKIVVTVPQTLHLMLKSHSNKALNDVGWIVLDEVHHIQEGYSGENWDWIFRLLCRDSAKFVALSATLASNEDFAGWLDHFRGETHGGGDFIYKPETYKKRIDPGSVACTHGSHIEVFPNGRPVKQQIFLFDRDFTKLPRGCIIAEDDEYLPFNIALSAAEDQKQLQHIRVEIKPSIAYDRALMKSTSRDAAVTGAAHAVTSAPGAPNADDEATPTKKWLALDKSISALVKRRASSSGSAQPQMAAVAKDLNVCAELLQKFLKSHMIAEPGWDTNSRAAAATENVSLFMAGVYLVLSFEVTPLVQETHELMWRCLVTHRLFRGMLARALSKALDAVTTSAIFSHFLEKVLQGLEDSLASVNSKFDETLLRTPNWVEEDSSDEEEGDTEEDVSLVDKTQSPVHLLRAMPIKQIHMVIKAVGDLLCDTFVDVKSQTETIVAACEAGLATKPAAIVYLCMDTLARFSTPPEALTQVTISAVTQCVENLATSAIAEAITLGNSDIQTTLCGLLGVDAAVTPDEELHHALFGKLLRLKNSNGRCIERMLALAMYANYFAPGEMQKVGKQLYNLATIDPEESDDEDEDDEDVISKAMLVLYRLIFLRVTIEQSDVATIKVDTQQCVMDFLHLAMNVEVMQSRDLMIEAIRHSFAFMVGAQLINIGECKSIIFSMLPGLEQSWPVVGTKTNPSKPIVSALQLLFNSIPHQEGETLVVDGKFGKKTEKRVMALQKSQDMEVTGVVDEMTWICLVGPLPQGATGLPVLALRKLLPVVMPSGHRANEPVPEPDSEQFQKFDNPLKKELQKMCKAVGGWLVLPNSVAEREWNHLLLRSLYANWDGSKEASAWNKAMRLCLKKAQILYKSGLGVNLVGELKTRLLWIIKCAYEGLPAFNGKNWEVTRYRMAQAFGILDSAWEMNAFSVSLSPYKTFKEDIDRPKEKLPTPQAIAVELLQRRSKAQTMFDRRAFEKLVYDIPERVKGDVSAEKQLLVALNIIGSCAEDGAFVLPPHVVLTMVEVLHDFPAPTGSKTKKQVENKCNELRSEWSTMAINPYVLNTLEGEVTVIEKKLAIDGGGKAVDDLEADEHFVRNWLYSTKNMQTLMDRFIKRDKNGGIRARRTLLRILAVLEYITAPGQQISRKVVSESYYLISAADRLMRISEVHKQLHEEVIEKAREIHKAWCMNKKISSMLRIFLVLVCRVYKGVGAESAAGGLLRVADVTYEDAHMYLNYHAGETLYDLRCLHMHEITGLQHYRELVMSLRKKQLLPALMFCLDRKKVEKIARHLAFQEGLVEVSEESKAAIDKVLPELAFSEPMGKSLGLFDMLRRGIGVHHADLSSQWRMEIESLFRSRHLQIVVATGTLAVGIHMPCKTVVFCGDNEKHLSVASFQQMAGRAGRQGMNMGSSSDIVMEPELDNASAYNDMGPVAEVGTVVLFGGFSKERTHHLMTAPAHFEEQKFFDTGSVLSLVDLANARMEGTEGYVRGIRAIETRSSYEWLQLCREKQLAKKKGVRFNPHASNVGRQKQQQLRAAFQNLRMMGMLDKNFEASLAVAVVQRMHLLSDPENLIFAQAVPFMAEHIVNLTTEKARIDMIVNMILFFFPEPRPYTRADEGLDWAPALSPLPPGVVNVVNMYNLENILNIMNLTKKPFDPPPNSRKLKPPNERRAADTVGAHVDEDGESIEMALDPRIRAQQLQVSGTEEDEEWYRPNPCAESLSGHCDNYIEAISYYTFVENANGVKSVLARCGRENVYKTLMWEGPFKAHVPAFLLDELGSVDVCARLNLSLSDLYGDLNGLTNVSRKFVQALQDMWCMMPQVTADDGRRFERWCTFGSGTMLEETTRWYLEEISRWLYDGMGAQADTDSMNIFIKQYKEETSLRARRWKDKMAQSFWNFCADGQGREIRLTQRAAAAHSNARQLVDRYNMVRRRGEAASSGVGRVKAYEKEVLQNLAIWLSTGANYESPEAIHAAFLKSLPEDQIHLVEPALYPLGIQFCKWMWEKRPRATRQYIVNNKLALAEAENTAMINLFSRSIWPTVNLVRKMVHGAVTECLPSLKPSTDKQAQAQAATINLVFARWCCRNFPEEVPVDPLCMSPEDGEVLLPQFQAIMDDMRAAGDAGGVQYPYMRLGCEFEVQKDTFQQAGGWLRGNRDGVELLIDTTKTMLELIDNRVKEDKEKQRSKFGRVKPLWAIETKEDAGDKYAAEMKSFDDREAREDSAKRGKRGGDD